MKNRYPGTQPFTAEQSALFYGRKQETEDLMKLIRFQQMVVLYGKSGLGKSSLLNTKIKQDIEEKKIAETFAVRFNAWTADGETPLSKTVEALSTFGKLQTFQKLNPLAPIADNTLWYAAKSRQLATGRQRFLLVFDQFEELFTYP
jgi:ABC-type phosphate transport system ATPase subunit